MKNQKLFKWIYTGLVTFLFLSLQLLLYNEIVTLILVNTILMGIGANSIVKHYLLSKYGNDKNSDRDSVVAQQDQQNSI